MTTELKRLVNLTAELQEIADQNIKEAEKELSKDDVLAIKTERALALHLLVSYGLCNYEKSYIEKQTAEEKGDFIIYSLVEDIKALCDLAIKKDYNATAYQCKKLGELINYVNILQKFFDYGGQ